MRTVGAEPQLITSHLGYSAAEPKTAILAMPGNAPVDVAVIRIGSVAHPVEVGAPERVAGWGTTVYRRLDFSAIDTAGTHTLEVRVRSRVLSAAVRISSDRLVESSVADITAAFRAARSSGEIDRKDRSAHFYDDPDGPTVDARGGWLDASGDYSKFLSHLTYTRMMSPQQIPLCAWALLAAHEALPVVHPTFRTSQHARLRDEGLFGADFLMRFCSSEGYFYTAIFDALTKQLDERVITAPLQNSVRTTRWQAAFRHGGGLAIAALARASTLDVSGEHPSADYLRVASAAFDHLAEHNTEYLFDGRESVIDDYCALLAATELAGAGAGERYLEAARQRVDALAARLAVDAFGTEYLVGDRLGRPFHHAVETGLPVVALDRFATLFPNDPATPRAIDVATRLMRALVERTDRVPNPFGLPRFLVQAEHADTPSEAFFFPHDNETGYWWQGENANLASVAHAATLIARRPETQSELAARLRRLASDCLGWVAGRNPFDACMLQGRGHNNVDYSSEYQNTPGAIVNGVTSAPHDEDGIAFLPDDMPDGDEWRWAEQWIPHSAWFVLAVCAAS